MAARRAFFLLLAFAAFSWRSCANRALARVV